MFALLGGEALLEYGLAEFLRDANAVILSFNN